MQLHRISTRIPLIIAMMGIITGLFILADSKQIDAIVTQIWYNGSIMTPQPLILNFADDGSDSVVKTFSGLTTTLTFHGGDGTPVNNHVCGAGAFFNNFTSPDFTCGTPSGGSTVNDKTCSTGQLFYKFQTPDFTCRGIATNELTDSNIVSPSNGQVYKYNSGNSKWENQADTDTGTTVNNITCSSGQFVNDFTAPTLTCGTPTGFTEIGRTTLGSGATTITVSSLPAKTYLYVRANIIASGSGTTLSIRFNGDTGNNYNYYQVEGTVSSNAANNSRCLTSANSVTSSIAMQFSVMDLSNKNKVLTGSSIMARGAGNTPFMENFICEWANTSSSISSITIVDVTTGNNMQTGSEVVVFGTN